MTKTIDRSDYYKEWAAKHPNASAERGRKWRQANRAKAHAYDATRAVITPGRSTKAVQKWREDHPEQYRLSNRMHQAKRKAQQLNAQVGEVTAQGLAEKLAYWGGKCWMCRKKAECWDHVKPLAKKGLHCLANLRPACEACNRSKGAKWPWPEQRSK